MYQMTGTYYKQFDIPSPYYIFQKEFRELELLHGEKKYMELMKSIALEIQNMFQNNGFPNCTVEARRSQPLGYFSVVLFILF